MDFETFYRAVSAQESGSAEGNYEAVNARTGARGRFQIMPDNWESWSTEALGYEGDFSDPATQDAVAKHKLKEYFDAYGPEGALAAWYAGPTNGARWAQGAPDAMSGDGHYSWDAPQGAGDEPSVREYIRSALGHAGQPNLGTALWGNVHQNSYGATPGSEALPPTAPSVWENVQDQWTKGIYESPVGMAVRNAMGGSGMATEPPLVVDNDLIQYVAKALPGDPTAQRWALVNAGSRAELDRMIQRKQDDAAREARIEEFQGSLLQKVPGFAAGLLAATLTDPTILLPMGAVSFGGKVGAKLAAPFLGYSNVLGTIARLGPKALSGVAPQTLMRYGEAAALQAGLFTGMGKLREDQGGYQQDYETLAMMGAFAGAGFSIFGDALGAFSRSREAARMKDSAGGLQKAAVAKTLGLEAPGEIESVEKVLREHHNPQSLDALGNTTASELAAQGKLLAVDGETLAKVAGRLGIPTEKLEALKAFHNPEEGITVLNTSNLPADINLDNLIAHEVGVHGGLANADPQALKQLKDAVEKKMKRPDESWRIAIAKAQGSGDWTEVFGHWIEGNAHLEENRITKQARYVFNKIRGTAEMTNEDLRDFAKRAVQAELDKARGYTLLPDGSAIVGGLKYSAESAANPDVLHHLLDVVEPKGIGGKISKSVEAGSFFGTTYGRLRHSPVKKMRDDALDLYEDARMRERPETAMVVTVEKQKEFLENQLTPHYNEYLIAREKYLGKGGVINTERLDFFDAAVYEAYNQIHGKNIAGGITEGWPAEVLEGVAALKKLRDKQITLGKKSGEMFGLSADHNLIHPEYEQIDDELWRRVDDDKHTNFMLKAGLEKGREFLEDYYKAYAKRDVIKREMEFEATLKAEASKAKAVNQGVLFEEPGQKIITPEMVEERVNDYAKKWSMGVGDQNLSNIALLKGEAPADKLGAEGFMTNRYPLDTSGVLVTPWGEEFSFDATLRSTAMDHIAPMSIKRVSGELALHNKFLTMDDLKTATADYDKAFNHAVKYGRMSPQEAEGIKQAWNRGINDIRGIAEFKEVNALTAQVCNSLRSLTYAKNGANFGVNQIGEMFGALATVGFKGLFHIVPDLFRIIQGMSHSKDGVALVHDAERRLWGENTERHVWKTDFRSRGYAEAMQNGSKWAKGLDLLQSVTTLAGRLTSSMSQLTRLTDLMVRGAREGVSLDFYKWAEGKEVGSVLRNPFSDAKLKAAGIHDPAPIKADFLKYAEGDKLNAEKWMEENPQTFWKWKNLVDQHAQMAITQPTIGNKALLANASPQMKTLFQFKDFSLKVMNSQIARVMTHRELDGVLSLLYSMAGNMLVYSSLVYGRAWAYYPTDEGKRKQYLKDRLTNRNVIMAGLLRSTAGAAVSFGTDIYEAATGSGTFRTSVNADVIKPQRELTWDEKVGRAAQQVPAVGSLVDMGKGVGSLYDLARVKADKRDLQNVMNNLPLRNFIPMLRIQQYVKDNSKLPEKRVN